MNAGCGNEVEKGKMLVFWHLMFLMELRPWAGLAEAQHIVGMQNLRGEEPGDMANCGQPGP